MKYLLTTLLLVCLAVVFVAAMEPSSRNPMQVPWTNLADLAGSPLQDDCKGTIEEIQYYLELGAEAIQKTNETDIIVVIGLSGSGKSTLVQFVANNSNTLRAECEWEECTLIDDSGSIGGNPVSETFIPNLVVEDITSTPFYDMPGFNDNRNQTIEIANSIFIRQIISDAKRMKIVIAQRQASLTPGDRITFVQTLKNLVKLIQAPEKFARSLALVGTVADYSKKDESLKGQYLAFIRSYIENAEGLFEAEDVPNVLAILNILGQTESEGGLTDPKYYGYFPSPAESGYLLEDPKFAESEKNLTDLILDRLEFATIEENDFGLPLSADALLLLAKTASCTSKSIAATMAAFSISLNSHIVTEFENIYEADPENLEKLSSLLTNLTSGDYAFADITGEDAEFYLHHLRNNVSSFSTDMTDTTLEQLDKYIQTFTFITPTGAEYSVEPKQWVQPLKDLGADSLQLLVETASSTSKSIAATMAAFSISLNSHIVTEFENIYEADPENLEKLSSLLTNLTSGDYSFADITGEDAEFYLHHLRNNVSSFSTDMNDTTLEQLDKYIEVFAFITSTGVEHNLEPNQWVQPLKDLIPDLIQGIATFANHSQTSTLAEIHEIAHAIFDKIILQFEVLSTVEKIQKLTAMETKLVTLRSSIDDITNNNNKTIVDLLTLYESDFSNLNVSSFLYPINTKKVMAVLDIVSEFDWRLKNWRSPVEESILLPLQNELNYTKFIKDLRTDLSTHQIQSGKQGGLVSWWSTSKPISASNFHDFWTKISQEGLTAQRHSREQMSSIIFGSSRYTNGFTSLLNTYLDTKSCTGATTDNPVVLSNFLSLKDALGNTSCLPTRSTRQSMTFIALDTLYVDGSIKGSEYDNNIDIFLIAPTIFLDSSVAFDLRGKTGAKGNFGGGTGEQGGQAGRFYFAYDAFDNRSSSVLMTVNLNGGDGGAGGKGSQGREGEQGNSKTFDVNDEDDCGAYDSWANIQIRVYPNSCNIPGQRCHAGDSGIEVEIYGYSGKNGSDGLKGGRGGARGPGGSSFTYDGFGRTETEYGDQGSAGEGGEGGNGGLGGLDGTTLVVHVDDTCCDWGSYYCMQYRSWEKNSTQRTSSGAVGPVGDLNSSNVAPRQPDLTTFRSKIAAYIQKANTIISNEFIGAKVSDFTKKLQKI